MSAAIAVAGRHVEYNEAVVKKFVIATMFWGVVAFLVGVVTRLRTGLARCSTSACRSLTFGRLRPVHTSAAIFAFGGNALIAHLVLCRAADLPRPPVRRRGVGEVPVLGLPVLHRHGGAGLRARASARARNTPSPNGTSTCS